jgi:hypothetical protein
MLRDMQEATKNPKRDVVNIYFEFCHGSEPEFKIPDLARLKGKIPDEFLGKSLLDSTKLAMGDSGANIFVPNACYVNDWYECMPKGTLLPGGGPAKRKGTILFAFDEDRDEYYTVFNTSIARVLAKLDSIAKDTPNVKVVFRIYIGYQSSAGRGESLFSESNVFKKYIGNKEYQNERRMGTWLPKK